MNPLRLSAHIVVLTLAMLSFWQISFSQPGVKESRPAPSQILDDFESIEGWRALPSEGARMNIIAAEGKIGKAMVMEFDLSAAYGYTIAQKDFPLELPENYEFTFDMRAEAPVNNFEFKLLDSAGNVWWIKKLNIQYPVKWSAQHIRRRNLTFAWGPSGGSEIHHLKSIEFVVSSGSGGKGKVYFDNFRFEPLDDPAAKTVRTSFDASSIGKNSVPQLLEADTILTNWRSAGKQLEWISFDFNYRKEIGGLVIDWEKDAFASKYDVVLSDDGKEWTNAYTVENGNGGRDYVYLPEGEGKFLKLLFERSRNESGYAIAKLTIRGPGFGATPNDFFTTVAGENRHGLFPKYFLQEQSYWTVVGASGDTKEALINEQGAVEVDKQGFSLEPFLFIDGKLVTWKDVSLSQSLEKEFLPIPSVNWRYGGWSLRVRAFAAGVAGKSLLIVSYRIENSGGTSTIQSGKAPGGKLFVALRPFQIVPPWQQLNIVGGASRIDSISRSSGAIHVNDKIVLPLTAPDAFGATRFEDGDLTEFLVNGAVPPSAATHDPLGFGSGALEYDFSVGSGGSKEYHVVVPLHDWSGSPSPGMNETSAGLYVELALSSTMNFWMSKLDKFHLTLPPSAQPIINTIKSNLAYIFINRDGPGIQPGSRTYERSWIRDGALTSTALLQMGITDEVREYIDWYAGYQYEDGKIPCVVDTRGADPTNEHDSHGEFIYAIMQYFRYTHDTTWLRNKFDRVVRTVRYIQRLRSERKTEAYVNGTPDQRACYGLVPESISHEGYSSKPMHSYWDDFFILRGLKDATDIAAVLREKKLEEEFSAERDDFKKDLYASMRLAMKIRNIDFIPGCAELGDFDATSTTIGVNPCNELGNIPEPQLHRTFDRYFELFTKRKDNSIPWGDYTPYENRVIGTFVFLGQKRRAREAMTYFLNDRRPAAWNHWAEVVHRDSADPGYVGDMPHTWVGSDFIRSVRSMFVYEREQDEALVLGAGIDEDWLKDSSGISVRDLPTYYGAIGYSMKQTNNIVVCEVDGKMKIPRGRIVLKSPLDIPIKQLLVNGKKTRMVRGDEIVILRLPSKVEIRY